jgi:rRNA-processing protein FCF1
MDAVLDSSSLISMARAGILPMLSMTPIEPVILDVVVDEVVTRGLAAGYADAAAIEAYFSGLSVRPAGQVRSVDTAVLEASQKAGVLVANDLALGRRARNAGVRWLRTADVVLLAVRAGGMAAAEGASAISALLSAGRLTDDLAASYREDLT